VVKRNNPYDPQCSTYVWRVPKVESDYYEVFPVAIQEQYCVPRCIQAEG